MTATAATILDWTTTAPNPPPRLVRDGQARYRTSAHGVFVRDPATVDTVCVHQTACHFGPHDDERKRRERALDVPIHSLAFNDGVAVLPYPPRWYLFHGNGWNARSVGIEIEGQFPGLEGGQGDTLSDAALAAACDGLAALVASARAQGCPVERIVAHRQSSPTRRSDPGGEIWRRVVLGFAVPTLGLVPQQAATLGEGRPIPLAWDPHGVGEF